MTNTKITDITIDTVYKRSIAKSKNYKSAGMVRTEMWPSQTSISIDGAICGSCIRSLYYKMLGVPGTSPDKDMVPKWERGIYIEKWYQEALDASEYISEAGYNFKLIGKNIKFKDTENLVSGEFDAIGLLEGEPIGIEFKTIGAFWMGVQETITGWNATAKETSMLQVMRYLHWTTNKAIKICTNTEICEHCNGTGIITEYNNEDPVHNQCSICHGSGYMSWQSAEECSSSEDGAMKIKKWRILYWMSGEEFAEYEIQLGKNRELIMYSWDKHGVKNKKVYSKVTIDNILKRQAILIECIHNLHLPDKDYFPKYEDKYAIINQIQDVNRAISGMKRRKTFTNPKECPNNKTKEDEQRLYELEEELNGLEKKLKQAYNQFINSRWLLHPPKYESWKDPKKNVGDWRCRPKFCSYRHLCDEDWNVSDIAVKENRDDKDIK